jgi:hypothetical protein
MPNSFANAHDKIIERYLASDHSTNQETVLKRVWMKRQDGSFIPAKITVTICASERLGLILVASINPFEDIVKENLNCNYKQAYLLLANELGIITDMSLSFQERFLKDRTVYLDELNF